MSAMNAPVFDNGLQGRKKTTSDTFVASPDPRGLSVVGTTYQAPNAPLRKRNTRSDPVLGASAFPIWNPVTGGIAKFCQWENCEENSKIWLNFIIILHVSNTIKKW